MTPNEISSKQFDKSMSGYRPDEVNAYLAEVADYVKSLMDDKSVLEEKMMILADKLEEYREDEDSLRAALIGAQKLGDSVVRESKKKAEMILTEAQQKADSMIADIKHSISRETDVLNRMQAEVARFKGQILSMYRQHIEMFNSIPYDEKDFPPQKHERQEKSEPVAKPEPQPQPQPVQPAVSSQAAAQPSAKTQPKKDFVVSFDEENLEYEDVPDEQQKKESRHGDLLFGERYPLTRKD